MERLLQDVRCGLRMLGRNPGGTFLAICALAVGIGANAAIFSVACPLLLRPEPFPNLGRLALMYNKVRTLTDENAMLAREYEAVRTHSRLFEQVAASTVVDASLTGRGEPERVQAAKVTPNFLGVLGVQPAFGRGFTAEEGTPGRDAEAILSYHLWQSKFAGDRSVLGNEMHINGRSYTIIGVMSKDFEYPLATDLWEPLAFTAKDLADHENNSFFPIGLLKRGVSVGQAAAELQGIGNELAKEFPETNANVSIRVVPFRTYATDEMTHNFMLLLLAAVAFVLLIACVNVANLQLARVAGREREIAVRAAMGATRWCVVRQLLTESVILSLAGAVLGLLLAGWAVSVLVAHIPPEISQYVAGWNRIALDWRAVTYTVAIAVLAGILAGLAPAVGGSKPNITGTLKEGGRSGGGRSSHRLRSVLVVGEVAVSLVLLVGAGLMIKGFRALLDAQQRFSPQSLLTMNITLPKNKYGEQTKWAQFYEQALAQMSAIPGVESASVASAVPNSTGQSFHPYAGENVPFAEDTGHAALGESISPNYFRTLRLPLLRGREFTDADGPNSQRVAILSRSMAARYWPGESAIGKRIKQGGPSSKSPWLTIVGIVDDAKYNAYFPVNAAVYVPYAQSAEMTAEFLLRTDGNPLDFFPSVRAKIANVDPDQPVYGAKTVAQLTHEGLIGISFVATMMAVLGLIALVLASAGVYGVMAQSVTERTHEIGVRLALGAKPLQVTQWIARRGMRLTAIGLLIGLALAFALARLMASVVYGVSATDPLIFAGVPLVLGLVALAACHLPARRAARVDPIVALRCE